MAVFDRISLDKNETPYGTNLDSAIADGLARAIKDGEQIVKSTLKNSKGFYINGWTYNTNIGTYGYNYLIRAAITEGGLGANVPEEAIYAKTKHWHRWTTLERCQQVHSAFRQRQYAACRCLLVIKHVQCDHFLVRTESYQSLLTRRSDNRTYV